MPLVALPVEDLNRSLKTALSLTEMEASLDQLGCDIEEFTTLRRYKCTQSPAIIELSPTEELPSRCPETGIEGKPETLWSFLGSVEVVKISLLPVRPDLFDPGGLVRALRGLRQEEIGLPSYHVGPPSLTVEIASSVAAEDSFRPYIACAVIRGLAIDEMALRLIMKMQEHLHWALGRDRKLASIGVYDLDTLQGPIHYKTVGRDEIRFIPLQTTDGSDLTPHEILTQHPKGIAYADLLSKHTRVPLLIDSAGQVLSMPPIINSHHTRVTTATRDVFIDVTGITEKAVTKTLHTLVTSLLEIFPKARAERVTLHRAATKGFSAEKSESPDFQTESFSFDVAAACRRIGIAVTPEEAALHLRRMRHSVTPDPASPKKLLVTVAPYRNDIMHEVDLVEDLAMAYGYDKIKPVLIPTMTVGKPRPERLLAERARQTLLGLSFFETMSLLLSNPQEQYDLLLEDERQDGVLLQNPASVEQTMVRTRLMPQLLTLFALNRGQGLPQKLFEVDDVVSLDDTGVPVERLHLAAGILASEIGFADIKALAQALSHELGLPLTYQPLTLPSMLPGRCAALLFQGRCIGHLGEIHPAVLEKLRLIQPLVALELDLTPLLSGETLFPEGHL